MSNRPSCADSGVDPPVRAGVRETVDEDPPLMQGAVGATLMIRVGAEDQYVAGLHRGDYDRCLFENAIAVRLRGDVSQPATPGNQAQGTVGLVGFIEGNDGLDGWHARMQVDQGEVGERDWRAARGRIAVLVVDARVDGVGTYKLFGGDHNVVAAVEAWQAEL